MRIGPFGIWEIVIILVVVLLIFGPSRLPEMAKGVGRSVRLFRKELRDVKADLDFTSPDPVPSTRPARAAAAPVAAEAASAAPAPDTAPSHARPPSGS